MRSRNLLCHRIESRSGENDIFLRHHFASKLSGNGSTMHDQHPVTHAQQFGKIAGNEEHGFATSGQSIDQPVYFRLGTDIDSARRFVENDDARFAVEPAGQESLLLIAAAERTDLLSGTRGSNAVRLNRSLNSVLFLAP